ncbi:phosphotransferase [Paenibacillus ferrarius]|uniref:phosphotransferase n=1 Tax=Paenibacillus ferrarius TaxID=1469647 RepID=UPI003D26D6C5
MLSKLLHFDMPDLGSEPNLNLVRSLLTNDLKQSFQNVKLYGCKPGGTLGVFFHAEINEERRFIKTHLPGQMYQNNLIKEIEILKILYSDCLHIERRDLKIQSENYTFLIMDNLRSLDDNPSIEIIRTLINQYGDKLKEKLNELDKHDGMYTFHHVYHTGLNALELLLKGQLVEPSVGIECEKLIRSLSVLTEQTDKVICHGDLSNKNIMLLENKPIVLDWEDCFLGVESYDLSYWLTFFDQRKYYDRELFSQFFVEPRRNVSLMLLITVLKCYLSYKNGSYKTNNVTFSQRLQQILALINN